jgi:hypothetical protein
MFDTFLQHLGCGLSALRIVRITGKEISVVAMRFSSLSDFPVRVPRLVRFSHGTEFGQISCKFLNRFGLEAAAVRFRIGAFTLKGDTGDLFMFRVPRRDDGTAKADNEF